MKPLYSLMLKGVLIGAVATLAVAGCSDSGSDDEPSGEAGDNSGGTSAGTKNDGGSKSDAGEPGSGGTSSTEAGSGGGPDTGGASDGGVGNAGGAGGAVDPGPDPFAVGGADGLGGAPYMGPALAKFCNSLTFGTDEEPMPTTFRLEVGEGNDKVTFTATTGECAPPDGEACQEIPTGEAVLVQMFDVDDDAEPVDFADAEIAENTQYVFTTDLATIMVEEEPVVVPVWAGLKINSRFACEDVTYADVP